MSIAVSYPGVYVQELPSGVRTIAGVSTSIAAFVDFFAAGPSSGATQIFGFAEFERIFGGLDARSEASYALQQFFLNGGSQAYVVRVSSGTPNNQALASAIALDDSADGTTVLVMSAASPGAAGDTILVDIDYNTADPATQFNLTANRPAGMGGPAASETFRNLVLDASKPNDAVALINAGSALVHLSASVTGSRPAQSGTAGKALAGTGALGALGLSVGDKLDVSLNGTKLGSTAGLIAVPASLGELASALQTQLRGVQNAGQAALPTATVNVAGSASTQAYLVVRPGTADAGDVIALSDGGSGLATKLGFTAASQNVQHYALGGAAVQAQAVPGGKQAKGSDGVWDPTSDAAGMATGLIGDPAAKTGMYALLDVDIFNILCVPATMNLPDTEAFQVSTSATALCTTRRAMYLLDVPQQAATRDTVPAIMAWLDNNAGLRSRNAALYFPRMDIADPLAGYRLRPVAPSGTVAGLYARTDGSRGVWKAPAGTEATLSGVQQLAYKLTDPENGVLNPLAINCLRVFPIVGPVAWGARTLNGADQMADDYKYVPIRRLALFIEESLYRGTQWAVFEPNDAPLWAQLRLNIGAFMQTLFRQGAFQGSTPQAAYFVACDDKTNPQATIDLGIVNVVVGFAPLKPAEFVVIQIQQMAGEVAN